MSYCCCLWLHAGRFISDWEDNVNENENGTGTKNALRVEVVERLGNQRSAYSALASKQGQSLRTPGRSRWPRMAASG